VPPEKGTASQTVRKDQEKVCPEDSMRYLSPLIADARGTLGGTIWSRDRSGPRISARTAPIQQQTPTQTNVRAAFAAAAQAWATLDATTRDVYGSAASTLTVTSSLGVTRQRTGYSLYQECFRNLAAIGQGIPTQPPVPYFHSLAGGAAPPVFITSSGVLTTASAVTTTSWFGVADSSVIQFTRGLSPGQAYIPRNAYRSLQSHGTFGGTGLDVLAGYLALFPSPAPGQTIAWRFRWIDGSTGQGAGWQYAQGTVSGT